MTTTAEMAMISHLSDAQHLLSINPEKSRMEINFAKMILLKYHDNIKQEVTWDELDGLWYECINSFGIRKEV